MNFAIEFLEFIVKMKLYCRIAGNAPREGSTLSRYGNKEDYVYKIAQSPIVFSAELVCGIKLDEYGIEITLK